MSSQCCISLSWQRHSLSYWSIVVSMRTFLMTSWKYTRRHWTGRYKTCVNQVVKLRTNVGYQFWVAYAQRLPILSAKILATKFGFVPDCSKWVQHPINSHYFYSISQIWSIDLAVPEIWLLENLTLKIKGQTREWVWSKSKPQSRPNILSTHFHFVPWQSAISHSARQSCWEDFKLCQPKWLM